MFGIECELEPTELWEKHRAVEAMRMEDGGVETVASKAKVVGEWGYAKDGEEETNGVKSIALGGTAVKTRSFSD